VPDGGNNQGRTLTDDRQEEAAEGAGADGVGGRAAGGRKATWQGLAGTRIAFRVRMLNMLLTNRIMATGSQFGLRTGAFTTMALIAANPGCSQADLAREGGLDKSGLVAIVDELEARGLARRGRVAGDRRRNSLSLTPEGEETMRAMYEVGMAAEQPIRDALSPAQLTTFLELLEVAFAAMEAAEQAPE
jgi:DNA-binding MarR family transcriptional regulator